MITYPRGMFVVNYETSRPHCIISNSFFQRMTHGCVLSVPVDPYVSLATLEHGFVADFRPHDQTAFYPKSEDIARDFQALFRYQNPQAAFQPGDVVKTCVDKGSQLRVILAAGYYDPATNRISYLQSPLKQDPISSPVQHISSVDTSVGRVRLWRIDSYSEEALLAASSASSLTGAVVDRLYPEELHQVQQILVAATNREPREFENAKDLYHQSSSLAAE